MPKPFLFNSGGCIKSIAKGVLTFLKGISPKVIGNQHFIQNSFYVRAYTRVNQKFMPFLVHE